MKHTWRITASDKDLAKVVSDFEALARPLARAGVVLAGPDGFDEPITGPDAIKLNGAFQCDHAPVVEVEKDSVLIGHSRRDGSLVRVRAFEYATPQAFEVPNPPNRPCVGTCKHNRFELVLPKSGVLEGSVTTDGRPYDIAVVAVLYLAKRHLKDAIEVSSDRSESWGDVVEFCNHFLNLRGKIKFARS